MRWAGDGMQAECHLKRTRMYRHVPSPTTHVDSTLAEAISTPYLPISTLAHDLFSFFIFFAPFFYSPGVRFFPFILGFSLAIPFGRFISLTRLLWIVTSVYGYIQRCAAAYTVCVFAGTLSVFASSVCLYTSNCATHNTIRFARMHAYVLITGRREEKKTTCETSERTNYKWCTDWYEFHACSSINPWCVCVLARHSASR